MKPDQLAVQPQQEPSVGLMIQQAMDKGISPDGLEKLVALYERMQDRQAGKDYAVAFVELQKAVSQEKIEASKIVPDKYGNVKFRFAPYEEIMAKVEPLIHEHGFTVTFDQKIEECRIVAVCKLKHSGGHCETNSFAVRIGSGPPGASECQADGAASTYAKRFALCNALNIKIEKEAMQSDIKIEGGAITQQEADELRDMVDESGGDRQKFLDFAHAKSFEDITTAVLPKLHASIRAKMKAAGK